MQMKYERKLPTADEIKKQYPLSREHTEAKKVFDKKVADIFKSESDNFLLIIGPCSADTPDSVMEYMYRLAKVQEQVKDKIVIIPRVYTNKPRTTGDGYYESCILGPEGNILEITE